ncbi:serine protease [Azorhizobium oxalatiphilum]|uniref:Serine protease n=1 Tax=Azorhizobium oxalatiphilum TaxID=980631 RepID=A0A917F5P0_9HYPH|nr:serine protease [Azorhizobium oxalatiphilum]GGF45940.1 serine protease [Azorhizobium oxalatiphilum]
MMRLRTGFCAVIALCGLGFLAAGQTPAMARQIDKYKVNAWNVSVYEDDDTGDFSHCVAYAEYKSGIVLNFVLNSKYNWGLLLFDVPGRFSKDDRFEVKYMVDRGVVRAAQAKAINGKAIYVPLPDNVALFREMRAGVRLHIDVRNRISTFRLDGTSDMLAALADCVRKRRGAPASADATPREDDAPPREGAPKNARQDKPGASSPRGTSTGSGFFVTADGVALTNAHVVEGCTEATISGYGKAKIVTRDQTNDLALLKIIDAGKTTPAKFRSQPLQLGESIFVMGFPLAGQLDNGLNFTGGIVSSLAGPGNDSRRLQFTAPIQPGNSGGPIVDESGLVIGVTQAKVNEMAALRASGTFPQNVNFGIKSDLATSFIRANAVEPILGEKGQPQPAVTVARDGRDYNVQIKCQPGGS